ncbi:choline dehydrogenase [Enterovirga rhinocerotis]|uniref:Choline dehydrogenase n=1 Tax=Enterovirga rhinocerotis TaxID=1339210 RepID=A0A4R7BIT8_9HYPH|nr:choline dehydrogenase [Enterovirga rhinocerotis]
MEFDFVVAGAGSAGCVVAARLAAAGHTVALIEAGPKDHTPFVHIPAGVGHLLYHPRYNWLYASEPEESSGNRAIHSPRGKVLGGSSSINGMLYVRGNPADYDGWAQLGCRGWSFEDVLPLFRRSEHYVQGGDPQVRGQGGPLKVEDYRTILPVTHLFVKAAQEAGFPFNPDYNGAEQEGVGYSQMTRIGRFRGSTYRTFLGSAASRRNVEIMTEATVASLILEEGRCAGVRILRGGAEREVRARREVILSAGAFGSPQVLQLSGIGDPEHLSNIGIETRVALSGVGRNLSDHYVMRLVAELRDLKTINQYVRGLPLLQEIVKYGLFGNGALTFGVTAAMIFTRSREGLASPDLQLLFTPASYVTGKALIVEKEPGVTIAVCPTRPRSRGTVLIDSADPRAKAKIRYGYLTDRDDLRVMLAGFEMARRIFAQPSLAPYLVHEKSPGREVTDEADLEGFARRDGTTLYHPVGTCKMGVDDRAVVDPELRVRGVEGLRVVDASVMPYLSTGNTNAPTIMIAEKASDMILAAAKGGGAARAA